MAVRPFGRLIPTVTSAGGLEGWGSGLVARVKSEPASCRARGGSQAAALLEDPQVPAGLFDPGFKESQAGRGGSPVKVPHSAGAVGEDERP